MNALLIIPPFTQLNTAYPSTAYIKGFLNTLHISSYQVDLSLETTLKIFSTQGLKDIFGIVDPLKLSEKNQALYLNRDKYIRTIESVVHFLQNKNPTLALNICSKHFLPYGHRKTEAEDLEWGFGTMGTHDKARHLATLYLEDLGDFITEVIDPHFGFSRYAERLGRTATHFDELYTAITHSDTYVTTIMKNILDDCMSTSQPDFVCLTIPFPGNVYCALSCGHHIKTHYPTTKVIIGGGYVNTELRSVYDERVFECVDYITLDDGEAPLQHLVEYFNGMRAKEDLKRCFALHHNGQVMYYNNSKDLDIAQRETGTPDYSDLKVNDYLSVIEVVNPMHRMWSDGWWNKLTMAHGCYWGKCAFCDVTLDYIKRYEPISAHILCDRIETIIKQTGKTGFHFVDEAAPPALMNDLAIEILRRGLTVTWWTNIRFEKSFSYDLCQLLRASGCIAVSGGLEVASDRLLQKMEKGVTVAQVAQVCHNFTKSGIMVHAYLMYGFPTQSAQETIDSLEMVRQLFGVGVIQSGFWHLFAMTAHSPVGLYPQQYDVSHIGPEFGGFAENDYYHSDSKGTQHERYSDGLKLSLYNYMIGTGLDEPLSLWFDFKVPRTSIAPDYIPQCLNSLSRPVVKKNDKVLWPGGQLLDINDMHNLKKRHSSISDNTPEYIELIFTGTDKNKTLYLEKNIGLWWANILKKLEEGKTMTIHELESDFSASSLGEWSTWINSDVFSYIRDSGLIIV